MSACPSFTLIAAKRDDSIEHKDTNAANAYARASYDHEAIIFAASQTCEREIVKPTHLCCDIVKYCGVLFAYRSDAEEVTMPAIAEILPTRSPHPAPRGSDLPTCPVCADSMIAAEASALLSDNQLSYLWTCDTCGYGFVTKHSFVALVCN